MENFTPPSMSDNSFQVCYSDREFSKLTSTFEELTIDVKGMVEELHKTSKRDTDLIRQDFIRNGIDSAMVTQIQNTGRQPPPGFANWPLTSLENQSSLDSKMDIKTGALGISETKSARRKRSPKEYEDYCVFCYNNREDLETYLGHPCRDENGFIVCPKLRKYVCPYCQATGDMAHTKKYCPKKPIITPDDLQTMVSPFVGQSGNRRNRNHSKRSLRF